MLHRHPGPASAAAARRPAAASYLAMPGRHAALWPQVMARAARVTPL
ncbi:hypothetical protein [Bradyrhizobium sp. WD16]|nr:hypothetical protein [Bradyrhizobium sp. WD16]